MYLLKNRGWDKTRFMYVHSSNVNRSPKAIDLILVQCTLYVCVVGGKWYSPYNRAVLSHRGTVLSLSMLLYGHTSETTCPVTGIRHRRHVLPAFIGTKCSEQANPQRQNTDGWLTGMRVKGLKSNCPRV